ncbi:MAG TPA: hypothetical protein PKD72_12840 [Gemmatales bacterium]|nr:hypothetical protein [Gemmatales bacterium]
MTVDDADVTWQIPDQTATRKKIDWSYPKLALTPGHWQVTVTIEHWHIDKKKYSRISNIYIIPVPYNTKQKLKVSS